MEYLHRNHIVHGSLKGNNVLIDSHGGAVITDFGRSLIVGDLNLHNDLLVFLLWVAPEILLTEDMDIVPVTKEGDIWSFGVTSLEVFCGVDGLWDGSKLMSSVIAQMNRFGSPAGNGMAFRSKVPDELQSILQQCWDYSSERRPTMKRVRQAIFDIVQ